MRLLHPKAACEGRHRQRHFSKIAGTVLLAALSALPLVLPPRAVAQEAVPPASSAADSTKNAVRPAEAATAPVPRERTWFERTWFEWRHNPKYCYFTLRIREGFDLLPPPITAARNLPLAIRSVPAHPDDMAAAGVDTSWTKPVPDGAGVSDPNRLLFMDLNLGSTVTMYKDAGEHVVGEFGAGAAFSLVGYDIARARNYLTWGKHPTYGDSSGDEEGTGRALTCYRIEPYALPGGDLDVRPYVFGELTASSSLREAFVVGVSLGYTAYWERVSAVAGWSRAEPRDVKADDHFDYSVSDWKRFKLMDLAMGLAYLRGSAGIKDESSYSDHDVFHLACLRVFAYGGLQHIIYKRVYDLARGIDFTFNNPALTFGVGLEGGFMGKGHEF